MIASKFNYNFTQEDIDKCYVFANTCSNHCYSQRNQNNRDKIINDIIVGKLGEIVAYQYIISKNNKCSMPDFKVYAPNEKSWQPDLITDNYKIHVKSQDNQQAKIFGASWTFQLSNKNNNYGKDTEIFRNNNTDIIVFTGVNLIKNRGSVFCIKKALDIIPILKDPIKKSLIGIKKVVYYKDLC